MKSCILGLALMAMGASNVLAEVVEREGYKMSFTTTSERKDSYSWKVKITGRVTGLNCKLLAIKVFMTNENGSMCSIYTSVKDVGYTSRLVEGFDTVMDPGSRWKVHSVYFDCQQ